MEQATPIGTVIASSTLPDPSRPSAETSTTTPASDSRPRYVWDGPDGKALAKALRLVATYPDIGMILAGNPGNGKTTAARQHAGMHWFWDCNDDSEADQGFLAGEDRYVYIHGRNAVIDDLGAEREFRDYGVRRELVGEWLSGLYKLWKNGAWRHRLFVTTNLDSAAVKARYGAPLLDRLLEMCVPVRFTGPSRRVRAGNRPLPPEERSLP